VVETVEPGSRGRAFGFFYFSSSIAALFSSVITGQLWKHYGGALPFYVSAATATLAAIMLLAAKAAPFKQESEGPSLDDSPTR